MRVLAYTSSVVPGGYDAAIAYLERTVDLYGERPHPAQ